jgi:hypothetical protein
MPFPLSIARGSSNSLRSVRLRGRGDFREAGRRRRERLRIALLPVDAWTNDENQTEESPPAGKVPRAGDMGPSRSRPSPIGPTIEGNASASEIYVRKPRLSKTVFAPRVPRRRER